MTTYAHLYQTRRWRRRSALQLRMFPLCAFCMKEGEGVVMPAEVADHIVPHRGSHELFFFGELQSLCRSHHAGDKAMLERHGHVRTTIGSDGWPVDKQF